MNEGENFVLCTIRRRVFKTHTQKKNTFEEEVVKTKQNKTTQQKTHTRKKKERKISVYGTEEDPEGEAVEDGGRTMAEQIKASVSKGVDKVKLM